MISEPASAPVAHPVDPIPPTPLNAGGAIGALAIAAGLPDLRALALHLLALPYGRPADRRNLSAPLLEGRGSCSSKHALLALAAREAGCDLTLMLGIYAMSGANTPGIAGVLARHGLDAVPEAHCYARIGDTRVDITGLAGAATASPFDALLWEEVITPEDVVEAKPALHRAFLDRWGAERGLDGARLWRVREECIAALEGRRR